MIKDYDEYIRRNLKRGISAKDMNISFFKEKELQYKSSVQDLQEEFKKNWDLIKREFDDTVHKVIDYWDSDRWRRGFVNKFIQPAGYGSASSPPSSPIRKRSYEIDEESDNDNSKKRKSTFEPSANNNSANSLKDLASRIFGRKSNDETKSL